MIDTEMTLDQKMEESEMKLFSGSAPIRSADLKSDGIQEKVVTDDNGRKRRKVIFKDEVDEGVDSGDDSNDENESEQEMEDDDDEDGSEESEESEIEGEDNEVEKESEKEKNLKKTFSDSDQESEEGSDDESSEADSDDEIPKAKKLKKNDKISFVNDDDSDVDDSKVLSRNKMLAREMGEDVSSDEDVEMKTKKKSKKSKTAKGETRMKKTLTDKALKNDLSSNIRETLANLGKSGIKIQVEDDKSESDVSENENVSAEECDDEDGDDNSDNDLIAWKSNLAEKASESFYDRQSNVTSLRKLVYGGTTDEKWSAQNGDSDDDDDDKAEIGGMFRVMSEGQAKKSSASSTMDQVSLSLNRLDCSS